MIRLPEQPPESPPAANDHRVAVWPVVRHAVHAVVPTRVPAWLRARLTPTRCQSDVEAHGRRDEAVEARPLQRHTCAWISDASGTWCSGCGVRLVREEPVRDVPEALIEPAWFIGDLRARIDLSRAVLVAGPFSSFEGVRRAVAVLGRTTTVGRDTVCMFVRDDGVYQELRDPVRGRELLAEATRQEPYPDTEGRDAPVEDAVAGGWVS